MTPFLGMGDLNCIAGSVALDTQGVHDCTTIWYRLIGYEGGECSWLVCIASDGIHSFL